MLPLLSVQASLARTAAVLDPFIAPLRAERDRLRAALKNCHRAMDTLFARLVEADPGFFPSKSGAPWNAMVEASNLLVSALAPGTGGTE